jgi:chromosome segregation ATPase
MKEAKEETAEASKQLHRVHREIEVLASDLESAKSALAQKESTVSQLERHKARTDLIQSNLVSELESLPLINKRLESDCAFLRDELKNCAQKITMISKENDFLSSKLNIVDSILSPEQRLRVNDKTGQPIPSKSEASAVSENKKLQIEAMELRMRLVDSQAARDRAQSQLIDQSQMIARLQKQLSISPTHQLQENVSPSDPSPIAQVAEVKRFKKSVDDRRLSAGVEQECKQQ